MFTKCVGRSELTIFKIINEWCEVVQCYPRFLKWISALIKQKQNTNLAAYFLLPWSSIKQISRFFFKVRWTSSDICCFSCMLAKMKRKIQKYLNSQAVDDGSSLSLLSFTLPLVHLQDQFEEGAFGGGDFSMPRPSQVLELTNHQVALLRLREWTTHTFRPNSQAQKHINTAWTYWPWWGCRLWRVCW